MGETVPRYNTKMNLEIQNELPQPQQAPEGSTFLRTSFNGLNAISGIGILSIPYAVSQGGWLSLILFVLVAAVCWFTGILLQRCMEVDPNIKTYPDIGEYAFGYKGRAIVSIFMYVELYLLAVEFLILEGDNLDKLFPNTGIKIVGMKIEGKKAFVLLTSLVVLPTTWLKSLSLLAYVSACGVLAPFIIVVCVFWIGAVDKVGFHERGTLLNWRGLPTAISMFSFCFTAHAIFPTLCSSMKHRNHFSKVLIVCFVGSCINYGSMAVLGYLMYGENLKSQVTLNLPIDKISTKIAIYTTLINPLTKYALIITPIANAIEEKALLHNKSLIIITRTALVISTVIVAISIPFFGYMTAFIGSLFSVTASMLLPCLCYLKINESARKFGLEMVIIAMIMVAGSCIAVVGTFLSVKQIVYHL